MPTDGARLYQALSELNMGVHFFGNGFAGAWNKLSSEVPITEAFGVLEILLGKMRYELVAVL